MQTARRVENDHSALPLFGVGQGRADNIHRLHVRAGLKAGDIKLAGQRAQLLDGGGAVDVGRDKVRLHLALAQKQRQLAR